MVRRKLNKNTAHRKAMLRNMVSSLFLHEKIETTLPKAKEVQRKAEKLITTAKNPDLHSRRMVIREIKDKKVVDKLFDEIAPRFQERPGGYTRVLKGYYRRGDSAEKAILELVE